MMRAMRAESFTGYGGLKLVERPKPLLADGRVLVRMTAAGVTPLDHTILSGGYARATAPLRLGNEGAGVVEDPGDSSFPVGARVMFTGPYGVFADGTYSEWLAVRGEDLCLIPDNIDDATAGGIPVAYLTEAKARQIVLAARPQDKPKPADFRLEEITIPTPSSGQVLLGVRYLSLDPYMRGRTDDRKSYAKPVQLGAVMEGESVATVIASERPDYAEGDIVLAQTGWRTHALSDGVGLRKLDPAVAPVTTGLGVLGMPGFTAYAGLRLIGKPHPGETVVVAAASGPVGSLVGQLAKIAGARAVGITGGPEKCTLVKNELRFDAATDHRAADFPAQLAAACPDGIDVYFENVGGSIWQAVLPLLNSFARVPVCGLIAQYNGTGKGDGTDRLPATMREILSKSLTLRGFINYEFAEQHYPDFLREVGAGIADGRIRYREDIVDGLENAPEAFIGILEGRNFGKLIIVRVDA